MLAQVLRFLPHKELGWKDIGEVFTRYTLLKTPLFRVYLHCLYAPRWHPMGHDHPWSFVTLILRGGYLEWTPSGKFYRPPGSVLHREAEFAHNVITGGVCWSLVVTGPKRREWQFVALEKRKPN